MSGASLRVAYPVGVAELHLQASRALRSLSIRRDAPVLVAVSGGADSTALVHSLAALGQPMRMAHVHHGLRGAAADRDARFVAALGQRLGVPCHVEHVDAGTRDGRSPEARARELRYGALESLRAQHGCVWIATAHTRDDQAETVLLRAIRGTGIDGLAGIRPIDLDRRLLRPLLRVAREDVRGYLVARKLAWSEDATNTDEQVPRNRIRRDVLPALERAHPGAVAKLAELAAHALADAGERADEVAAARARVSTRGDGGTWVDAAPIAALDTSVGLRVWSSLLTDAGLGERITRAHLSRVADFALTARSGTALSLPLGCALIADRTRVWLGPASGPQFPEALAPRALEPAHVAEFPERGLRLSFRQTLCTPPGCWSVPAPSSLASPWRVRSAHPSDRLGGNQPVPIRHLFDQRGWSRAQRARALVVESDQGPIWLPGLAVGEQLQNAAPRAGWWCAEPLSRLWESC